MRKIRTKRFTQRKSFCCSLFDNNLPKIRTQLKKGISQMGFSLKIFGKKIQKVYLFVVFIWDFKFLISFFRYLVKLFLRILTQSIVCTICSCLFICFFPLIVKQIKLKKSVKCFLQNTKIGLKKKIIVSFQ